MKSRCPWCRAEIDLAEVFREGDLHAIIKLLPTFAPHGRIVWEYIELFGITPISRHTAKIRRLLAEIEYMWSSEAFRVGRDLYGISPAGIAEAMRACVSRSDLKLKNHNYLKQIMASISERQTRERSIAAEAALRKKEERLQAGEILPRPSGEGRGEGEYEMPEAVQERIRKIGQGIFKP